MSPGNYSYATKPPDLAFGFGTTAGRFMLLLRESASCALTGPPRWRPSFFCALCDNQGPPLAAAKVPLRVPINRGRHAVGGSTSAEIEAVADLWFFHTGSQQIGT